MSKSVDVIGLIVFVAAVISILWVVARNMPMIGVIAGSVLATVGLGWGLVQVVGGVSSAAYTRWNAGSSLAGVLCGFAIFGLGVGVAAASVMGARSGDQAQPPRLRSEDSATEGNATEGNATEMATVSVRRP